jgi:hypothetical protein
MRQPVATGRSLPYRASIALQTLENLNHRLLRYGFIYSLFKAVYRQIVERVVNNEWERMWKEALIV